MHTKKTKVILAAIKLKMIEFALCKDVKIHDSPLIKSDEIFAVLELSVTLLCRPYNWL